MEIPSEKPLTLVSYECNLTTRGYIERIAVGNTIPNMPLDLEPDLFIQLPLEKTYTEPWDSVPSSWQQVIDPSLSA